MSLTAQTKDVNLPIQSDILTSKEWTKKDHTALYDEGIEIPQNIIAERIENAYTALGYKKLDGRNDQGIQDASTFTLKSLHHRGKLIMTYGLTDVDVVDGNIVAPTFDNFLQPLHGENSIQFQKKLEQCLQEGKKIVELGRFISARALSYSYFQVCEQMVNSGRLPSEQFHMLYEGWELDKNNYPVPFVLNLWLLSNLALEVIKSNIGLIIFNCTDGGMVTPPFADKRIYIKGARNTVREISTLFDIVEVPAIWNEDVYSTPYSPYAHSHKDIYITGIITNNAKKKLLTLLSVVRPIIEQYNMLFDLNTINEITSQ